jgi:apolipoprotein N-acyltransferase
MERLAGNVMLLWGWRRYLAAFAAGALAVLGQAPYDFFAACFVAFPVLVWLLDGCAAAPSASFVRRLAPGFAVGWWFGFGYFLAGLWWMGNALLVEAESHAWALPFAVLGLPAGLALFFGLAAALARFAWSDDIGRIAALAAGFGIAEWLRAVVLTGFPWNAVGYAAMPTPLLMQSVALTGVYGMNVLAVFVFSLPALLAGRRHRRLGAALAALLIAAHAGYGAARLRLADAAPERTLTARIVQASIDQREKWDPGVRDRIFRTYLDLSAGPTEAGKPRPELILWPETALPFLLTDRPDALAEIARLLEPGQMLLTGAVRAEGDELATRRYYNSVIAIDDAGQIADAADKLHLVPFGEYLPLGDLLERAGVTKIVPLPLTFSAGTARRLLTLPGGARALPFICYEIIFSGAMATDADLIVNVTNDTWFGDTPGPLQHFRQAQIRAVESGLPLLRAANNGISGAVDSYGRVVDAFALNAVGRLDVTLPLIHASPLPPAWIWLDGLAIFVILATIACIFGIKSRLSTN